MRRRWIEPYRSDRPKEHAFTGGVEVAEVQRYALMISGRMARVLLATRRELVNKELERDPPAAAAAA